jgi:hypothetical protein
MTTSAIVILVFSILTGVQVILAALGAALPATNTVGIWCRKLGVDVKWVLGLEHTVEAVVPVITTVVSGGSTGAATPVTTVVSAVESVIK